MDFNPNMDGAWQICSKNYICTSGDGGEIIAAPTHTILYHVSSVEHRSIDTNVNLGSGTIMVIDIDDRCVNKF